MRSWMPCWERSSFGSRSRSPRWPRASFKIGPGRAAETAGALIPHCGIIHTARAVRAAHYVIVGNRPALYKVAREQEGSPKHGVAMRSEKNRNGAVALLEKNGAVALLDKNKSYRPSDKEPF